MLCALVSILNFDRETKVNDCKYKNKIPVLNRRFHYFHFDCLARVSTAKQLSILEKVIVIQYHHNYPIGRRGFTLVELVLLVAIIGIIAGIAIPSYSSYIKKAKIKQAVADLKTISLEIEMFKAGNPGLPANLATVPGINLIDPWGNPYVYSLEQDGEYPYGLSCYAVGGLPGGEDDEADIVFQ